MRLGFEYDRPGRRIRKQFYTHHGSGWVEQRDTVCLYDGWNGVAELDAHAGLARLRAYVWGSDLSGSLPDGPNGAGGVGGLLWLNNFQTSYDGQSLPTGVHWVAYDGHGNVLALFHAPSSALSGRCEYGPFGEPVRVSGALAAAQPFRFSTKWTDAETGLLYYGYRYYNPATGRWPCRDPIEEWGGTHLYGFVGNAPSIRWDADGRFTYPLHLLITAVAGWGAGLSADCVRKIAFANANTDIWHPLDHSFHFTRPVRGDKARQSRLPTKERRSCYARSAN